VPATARHRDPAPLSLSQVSALIAAATRELVWGLRSVRTTVRHWQARAAAIPDPVMRRDALAALSDKRPLLDGAALFWILPTRRHQELVELLVAFQILANFHDHAGERAGAGATSEAAVAGSIRTLGAIVDVERPWPGYFGTGPRADGGYLDALADTCRSASARLPGYGMARATLIAETRRAEVMDIEHQADRHARPLLLRRFAEQLGDDNGMEWWELAAGAASLMTAIVTLALAADERTTSDDLRRATDAYILVGGVGSLLDNYIDQRDDARTGAHNYMTYYPTPEIAGERLGLLIERALREVGALRRGEHHLVIVASMTAMYLTSESARSDVLQARTRELIGRGGALTKLLVPMLRAWRGAYAESDA
jgi:tetraprenyl-beta-curcumene synthase